MWDILIPLIIVAVAAWYLYRRFVTPFTKGEPSCGCGGCGSCDTNIEVEAGLKEQKPHECTK